MSYDDDPPPASKKGGKAIKPTKVAGSKGGGKSGAKFHMPKGKTSSPPKVHVPGPAKQAPNLFKKKR